MFLSSLIASLYICNILFAFITNGTVPIYYEITVEGVYPVAEGIVTGVLSWLNAFTGIIFLLVMMKPNIGKYKPVARGVRGCDAPPQICQKVHFLSQSGPKMGFYEGG